MRVTVDGQGVEIASGASVLAAVQAAGRYLPTLCWDPRTSPGGSCRTCLVAVERSSEGSEPENGRSVVASCTTPAAEGMVIHTDHPVATSAVRGTLGLLVSSLPARALDLPAERSELVTACAALGVPAPPPDGRTVDRVDHTHPYVRFDPDLCITCGRCVRMCDEVQGTYALTIAGRGGDAVLVAGANDLWIDSPCVACGGCVDACPTGALVEPGLADPRPIETITRTTCGFCGVGCSLEVQTRNGTIAAVTPALDGPVNRGHACVKGRFAHGFATAPDRLTTPLLRRNGSLEPATWEEALELIGERLRRIVADDGPDTVAAISSARATNEENYLLQKLMRVAIGTNNVDNCSRLCHAPSAAGLVAAFGLAGGTGSFDDLDRADCILLVGANPTEAHPVVGARLKQVLRQGARLVVIDPRRTELAEIADVHLAGRPGSNVAVFHGIAHLLVAGGYVDEAFIQERASGYDELLGTLVDYDPDRVARIAGVSADDLRSAARLFGAAKRPAIVYGLGVTEHAHGTDGVRALANLAILRGAVGTVSGCGIMPLRGQNNVQGASDMGALPDLLPGYQRVTDPEARGRVGAAWGIQAPPEPGLRIPQMFDAAIDGHLKALYVMGEDIAQTDPDTSHVREAIAACELVVVQEIFLSQTAQLADVVLPAASFLEKDGTFVNFDRRFQRVRPALSPPGEARTDFLIINSVAQALGVDLGCPTPADALRECAAVAPLFGGLSHHRLDAEGALHWPCRSAEDPGETTLYLDRFATPDGRAALGARPYLPPGEQPDDAYPFILVTGRRLEHYNAGTMTRRTANLLLLPHERLDVNPIDAARLGLADGGPVVVTSRRGQLKVAAQVTETVSPGEVFLAFHFPDAPVNQLTSGWTDEVTGCPEYKVTAVRIQSGHGDDG
jgi:formate dehydrogenase major subunit